jgi:hypothetical protein
MTDLKWQRLFAVSGLIFALFCGAGLEIFGPQPPKFSASAAGTARFYVEHRDGVLWLTTSCGISMAFLLAWSIQLGIMLWRRPNLSRPAVLVGIVSLCASPILLSFDLTFFGVAAYRPGAVSPDVTQMLSDVAWIGSMLIWPQLGAAMAIVGMLMLRDGAKPLFPKWLGWFSIFCAVVEPFQLGIVFAKDGAFGPRGWTTWYAAVATWGVWILATSVVMCRHLWAAPEVEGSPAVLAGVGTGA